MGKKNNLYFSYYFITYLNEREKCKLTYPTLSHYLPKLHIIKVNDCMQSLRSLVVNKLPIRLSIKGHDHHQYFFFKFYFPNFITGVFTMLT